MQEADLEPRFSEISSEDRELGYLAVKALWRAGRDLQRFLSDGSGGFRGVPGVAGIWNPNSR